MDGPTLITQPPGYPEERPETDDMDGMLEHLASELEGKQLLEKPRVSKKVTLLVTDSRNTAAVDYAKFQLNIVYAYHTAVLCVQRYVVCRT